MQTLIKQVITLSFAVLAILLIMPSFPSLAQTDLPPVSDTPSIPMLSGGVGADELERLKSVEKQYNLKLLITEADGVFLADLPLTITDKAGKVVVDTVTRGPIFLATLPKGTYTVTVISEGETKKQKVSVKDNVLKEYHISFRTVDPKTSGDAPTVQ